MPPTRSKENEIRCWKLDGAGNTFVGLDNRDQTLPMEGPERDALICALCDSVRGLATDGAIIVERPANAEKANVRMRYHNRDGREAEMCGNGARCLALFSHCLGASPSRGMTIETRGGLQRADVLEKDENSGEVQIRLYMPDVGPMAKTGEIRAGGWVGEAYRLHVGVPHAVIWLDESELEHFDVEGVGRTLRHHPAFSPEGTNANFICIGGMITSGLSPSKTASGNSSEDVNDSEFPPSQLILRTYERGVERETLACGTGSVASALTAAALGRLSLPTAVRVRSGVDLIVNGAQGIDGWTRRITLQGPARMLWFATTRWNPIHKVLAIPASNSENL